ncbi:hypothetical protein REPUB_Repub03eG0108800 [Reevesia pubescens]
MNVQLTREEINELHRSRKKIDATNAPSIEASKEARPLALRKLVSYRDSLLGGDYGSFADTIEMETYGMDGNYSGDDEPMHEVYGKTIGYRFLTFKLDKLWSSIGKPCIVDLGKWEPNFKATEASFTSIAVWVRLPELPVKYFDLEILKKIGKSIGILLRVDRHTLAGERGMYARICVQVSLKKPLPTYIKVEGRKEVLVYESIEATTKTDAMTSCKVSLQASTMDANTATPPGSDVMEDIEPWRVVPR